MKYILALCCPDPANPCKHIGAVYYMLGDRFSEDPCVLFQLRGRLKEEIIAKLRNIRKPIGFPSIQGGLFDLKKLGSA
ncbi:hypothetical protein HFV01_18350 [Limnospira fusiformis SAG 85.79]|nr:hypothetical protein HFV01_18350 [Limnospira fusiformis SAG 85.79]QNH60445.1 MAG: hypothetical protein H2674_08320 [Limnospira indica BM01]UWU49718.1 hypothetical protein APLC1_4596 [Arthrospira platensis C1]BDT12948.1 hypothetical protein N39L_26710 [Arthrospira platensis NIES-39]